MSLLVERSEGILRITLDRPEKRNAITISMWHELERTLTGLMSEDSVLILAGSGGTFSAGSDVTEFLDVSYDLAAGIEATHRVVSAIAELGIPSIAVVDGVAAGSALNLALACDFVLASERASFSQIFARRGLSVDSGASWFLPRLVGQRRANQMLMLGDAIDAQTAREWGLVTAVVAPEGLDSEADLLADRLRAVPSRAMSGTRKLLAETWNRTLTEALAAEAENQLVVLGSSETQELINAFTTKGQDGKQ